jgi:TRAP transporter TAXI family solute receptor
VGYKSKVLIVALGWAALITAGWLVVDSRGNRRLTIAAGPREGEAFLLADAIAKVARKIHPELRFEVLETAGSGENMRLVETGRVAFATVQADLEAAQNVRLVAPLFPDSFQLLVAESAGIAEVADLAGHRIAIPPEGGGQFRSFWFLAEHYGLDPSALTALPMSTKAANFAMLEGSVDAVFRVRAPGNASILELIDSAPTRLVPIQHGLALALKNPALGPGTIPAGSYRGHPPLPQRDLHTVIVERLLVARAALETELVRDLTNMLFEQRTGLVAITPLAGFIKAPDRMKATAMPVHPGAQQYYDREKPSFWDRNARAIAPAISVFALALSGFVALRARLQRSRKDRADRYNLELMRISEEARTTSDRVRLLEVRDELLQILRTVLEDLEHDRVTREEFEFFSFTWQAADAVIRDELSRRDAGAERGAAAPSPGGS